MTQPKPPDFDKPPTVMDWVTALEILVCAFGFLAFVVEWTQI